MRTRDPGSGGGADDLAERIACRLDVPVSVGGVVLVVVLVADDLTPPGSALSDVWTVAAWALWSLFVVEFAARLVVAEAAGAFLRRNWWQLVFLAVPFLRFLRAFGRAARLARVAATSARTTRTAGRTLVGRIGWLVGAAVTTVLASSEVLHQYGPDLSYGRALHASTLAAVGGEPIDAPGAVADVLDVVLVLHATVVFATLAGSVGAYFVERRSFAVSRADARPTTRPRPRPRGRRGAPPTGAWSPRAR